MHPEKFHVICVIGGYTPSEIKRPDNILHAAFRINVNTNSIISKVWGFCTTLGDDGVGYGDKLVEFAYHPQDKRTDAGDLGLQVVEQGGDSKILES